MATYRNKNDDTIIRGSEFKLNISMDVIDSYHMYLFCMNNGGSNTYSSPYIEIKSVEMYNGSTLVRSYIPVRKNGVGYLYDRVSGELFGNANSTGAFTYGNDV